MEKIKRALEQARADRGLSKSVLESPVDRTSIESKIAYSKTEVKEPDRDLLRANNIVFDDTERDGLTAYKMLRTQVLQRMVAKDWNTLALTSPAPEDGKTVTAINLAISLARELHHTVLLVDLDLRNPSIHKYFGLEIEHGIGDYLLSGTPLDRILINPGIERLVLLPGRQPIENSSEILASPTMGELVNDLKLRYPSRFVLFDLPPILSADDALSFSPFVDAFLLVLRDGKTTRQEIQHAADLLKDTAIVGTVLNGSSEKISAYY